MKGHLKTVKSLTDDLTKTKEEKKQMEATMNELKKYSELKATESQRELNTTTRELIDVKQKLADTQAVSP